MKCKFEAGQKVVCVFNGNFPEWKGIFYYSLVEELEIGKIYTVTSVGIFNNFWWSLNDGNYFGVTLKEFGNYQFLARRFKPLEEKKTDISVLKKLLIPVSKEIVKRKRVKENA